MSGDDQGEEKKKEKKKKSKHKDAGGFKIIDQNDFPLEQVKSSKKVKKEPSDDEAEALALMTTQEELPQVAGIVDDSRLKTRFTTGGWKNAFEVKKEPVSDTDPDPQSPRRRRHDSDESPLRRKRHDSDDSPPRRKRHDSNQSPRRQRHNSDHSPPRRKRDHKAPSNDSPPRRKSRWSNYDDADAPVKVKKEPLDDDSDVSPPRRRRR